jgi:hypothetical protein
LFDLLWTSRVDLFNFDTVVISDGLVPDMAFSEMARTDVALLGDHEFV